MKTLLLASIIALTASHSFAQTSTVFAVDVKLEFDAPTVPSSHFELLSHGRWSFVETVEGKVTRRAAGTLARPQVIAIQRAIASAKWTNRIAKIEGPRCMADSIEHTEFSSGGHLLFVDKLCSYNELDPTSTKRLAQIMAIVNPLIASAE
jgi:hypothetical protein